jgi:hypothetical protein
MYLMNINYFQYETAEKGGKTFVLFLYENSNHNTVDQEIKGKKIVLSNGCYAIPFTIRKSGATDTPGNLPSPGEPGCSWA